MEIANRDLAGADIPPFSYTAIAHTPKNSPFNDYPSAMARLRWFASSFDLGDGTLDRALEQASETDLLALVKQSEDHSPYEGRLRFLRSLLLSRAKATGNFTYLYVGEAALVDSILDATHREITGHTGGRSGGMGPHEPPIGRWVNEDDVTEVHHVMLPAGIDRQALYDLVHRHLEIQPVEAVQFDELYLYSPEYGAEPEDPVHHTFRVFGLGKRAPGAAGRSGMTLGAAVESALLQAGSPVS